MTQDAPNAEDAPAQERESWLARLDRHVYGFEMGIVTGALLVMTFTYVFMIIHRQMTGDVTIFDEKIFHFYGYADEGEVPIELRDKITGLITPLILSLVTYVLALLALRTRWRSSNPESEEKEPWKRFFGLSVVVTAVLYAIMKIIGETPSEYLCVLVTAACFIPAIIHSGRAREWGQLAGFLFGGLFVGTFFLTEVDGAYPWAGHFALVLLFYVGFMGASMATRDGRHVTIDAVRKKIPRKHLYLYNVVGLGVTILFTTFLLYLAYEHLSKPVSDYLEFKGSGEASGYGHYIEGTELPIFMVTLPIFLAFIMMILRFGGRFIHDLAAWRRGELPPEPTVDLH